MQVRVMSSRQLMVVAAALVDGDGRVLVQQRSACRSMAGLWEFPGGKIEADETPEAALRRELNEELGIDVNVTNLEPAGFASEALGDQHLILLLYVCREWSGTPRAIESPALQWLEPDALRHLAMPPADRPLISVLERLI
ncbi:MAG: (deoxy)nucleoside triphosphate pyrophosphohydrolase [Sphingomonadaceae bacterium]